MQIGPIMPGRLRPLPPGSRRSTGASTSRSRTTSAAAAITTTTTAAASPHRRHARRRPARRREGRRRGAVRRPPRPPPISPTRTDVRPTPWIASAPAARRTATTSSTPAVIMPMLLPAASPATAACCGPTPAPAPPPSQRRSHHDEPPRSRRRGRRPPAAQCVERPAEVGDQRPAGQPEREERDRRAERVEHRPAHRVQCANTAWTAGAAAASAPPPPGGDDHRPRRRGVRRREPCAVPVRGLPGQPGECGRRHRHGEHRVGQQVHRLGVLVDVQGAAAARPGRQGEDDDDRRLLREQRRHPGAREGSHQRRGARREPQLARSRTPARHAGTSSGRLSAHDPEGRADSSTSSAAVSGRKPGAPCPGPANAAYQA